MQKKTNTCKESRLYAFTLVELSIVLVIIALLISGVIAGQELVKNSKLQNVITEIREYDTAIKQFKEKFKYYPGDLPNASAYWGTYAAGPPITGANNGNGDWRVLSTTTEALYSWRHLALAGFIPGEYTGATSTPTYEIGVNLPGSKVNSTADYFFLHASDNFQTNGHVLMLAKNMGNDWSWDHEIITVGGAYFIDTKIDDGYAHKGTLYGIDGGTTGSTSNGDCSAKHNATPADYNLSTTIVACRLFWWLDKEQVENAVIPEFKKS